MYIYIPIIFDQTMEGGTVPVDSPVLSKYK